MNELVSIIITAYNADKTIKKCIDSAVRQTYRKIEVVVVDDGSTDNTKDICLDYKTSNPLIKYIWQKNQGVAAARNKALQIISGSYFTFLDSDDWMESDMIETMMSYVDSSDVDIVICNAAVETNTFDRSVGHNNYFLGGGTQVVSTPDEKRKLLLPCISRLPEKKETCKYMHCGTAWCKLYKSSIIKSKGLRFYDDLIIGEDMMFFIYAVEYADIIKYIPDVLYHYVINDSSLTHKYQENLTDIYIRIRDYLVDYVKSLHSNDEEYIVQLGWFMVESLNLLITNYSGSVTGGIRSLDCQLNTFINEEEVLLSLEMINAEDIIGYGDVFKIILACAKKRSFRRAIIYRQFMNMKNRLRRILKE